MSGPPPKPAAWHTAAPAEPLRIVPAEETSVTDISSDRGQDDAAGLLGDVERFLARFVAYPSDAARIAHVLWLAHSWVMDAWENTPRLAFLSPEPGSGKSRALEVSELLVPRPVHAVNVSPAYLFRKVSDPEGAPTILFDEIDTVFGPKARENEDLRGLLNAGHRRGAVAGRCVVRGKNVETEELPAYAAVAVAGLHDLPDTLASRAVIVRMRRRAPHERIESFRHRVVARQAAPLADHLRSWVEHHEHDLRDAWPDLPDEVTDRDADCWEPLVAVADAAGGDWPTRARVAAMTLVTDARAHARESLGIRLLADLADCFTTHRNPPHLSTEDVLTYLTGLDEAPWGDLRGKPLDARGLSRRLGGYGVRPKTVRLGDRTAKGYEAADLADPWARYLARAPAQTSVTPVTPVTKTPEPTLWTDDVPDVTDVTATSSHERACSVCGDRLIDVLGTGVHPTCEEAS